MAMARQFQVPKVLSLAALANDPEVELIVNLTPQVGPRRGHRFSASVADHAHNAILNLAVTTGAPGVLLALVWTVVLPCRDLARCLRSGADVATTNLFLRIWAFALAVRKT